MSMKSARSLMRSARPDEAHLAVRSKAYWGYSDEFMRYAAALLTVTPEYLTQYEGYVLTKDKQLQGFASLQEQTPDEVALDMLFVAPEAMGQGVGQQLVEYVLGVAAAAGYRTLLVESDPNAAGFYAKMGGQLVGHRPVPTIPGRELPLYRIYLTD